MRNKTTREKTDDTDAPKLQISLIRKIIISIFIIGFWLIFYWYKTPKPPAEQSPQNPAAESVPHEK